MKRFIYPSIIAFVMIGCGSSHGPAATATIGGVAIDDLIVDGNVTAYSADKSTVLAHGSTDQDGTYSLQVQYDGVAVVEVKCTQGISKMKAPDGTLSDCDPGLTLRSAAKVEPGKEAKVPVTVLTEALVRQMDGDVTPQKLEEARNNLSVMFGVDPLTLPTDTTPSAQHYSKILDAVHEVAKDENLSLTEVIDDLAEDLSDGEAGDDTNLTKKLAQQMKAEGISNNLTEHNGTYAPSPQEIAAADKISAAKRLFAELRTQIGSLANPQENGFLDLETDKIADALDHSVVDVDYVTKMISKGFETIKHMKENNLMTYSPDLEGGFMGTGKQVSWTYTAPATFSYTIGIDDSGTFALPPIDPDNFNISTMTSPLYASIHGTLPAVADQNLAAQAFAAQASLSKSGSTATLHFDANISSGADTIALQDVVANAQFAANGEHDYTELASLKLHEVRGPYTFDGTLSLPHYVVNPTASIEGHHIPDTLSFNGTVSDNNTSSSLEGSLQIHWSNAANMNLSSDDKPKGKIQMSGTLHMSQRPDIALMLGVDNSGTGIDYNLTYANDNISVEGMAQLDQNGENGTIDFGSGEGVHIHMKLLNGDIDTTESNVTKDGTLIGRFVERENGTFIKYVDNTFESLQ